jgi:uncharacterized protein
MCRALGCLLGAAVLAAVMTAGGGVVHAQDERIQIAQRENPISSFFRSIFGGPQRQGAPAGHGPSRRVDQLPQQQQQPSRSAPQGQQRSQRAAPATPAVVEKDPDAYRVVVFGDFFASGLRSGLEDAFAQSSSVVVDGQSNASSGLVRVDFYDWPAAMRAYLDDPETDIDVAVIMIGGNDRQPLREAGSEHAPRSERWRELYAQRIDEVIRLFHEARVPVYWVGLPPVESARLSQDYAFFNDLYRERAYRAGADFVDIWNSFVDEDGNYDSHGPDIIGEHRQLRREDGLHFTAAGDRKLAHFVARDIRRNIDRDGDLTAALPRGPIGPQPYMPGEEEQESGIGQVVSLTGAPSEVLGLAGGIDPTPEPPDDSAYFRTMVLGESPEPMPGRADDFSWTPEPEAAVPVQEFRAPPAGG